MSFLLSSLFAFLALTSTPTYVAALGDSVMRGDMLPTCSSSSSPCPQSFFDNAARASNSVGIQYDFGVDGITAGWPGGGGVITTELPKYCGTRLPFAYTVVNVGGNDIHQWQIGAFGNVSLQTVFGNYAKMVADIRSSGCHPETKLIMVSMRDNGFACHTSQTPFLNEYNGYIRALVASTPGSSYMDVWGAHSNGDGTGVPIQVAGRPWYYGSNMYGIVNGVQTGGNCVHPGLLGHVAYGQALYSKMTQAQSQVTTQLHVAALGDSILRGNALPTCTGPATPCSQNFMDDALKVRVADGAQYNFALDGRDSGGGPQGGGIVGQELPAYCSAHVPFAFTTIHTGGNDVELWRTGYYGNVSLKQVGLYYANMVAAVRQCHPETKLIMVSVRDYAFSCHRTSIDLADQQSLATFNSYIRATVAVTANSRYMDVWGTHSKPDGTGVPVYDASKPWYYGSDMYGIVNGQQTGGDCKHPGLLGDQIYARSLIALMWPFV